MAQKTSADGGTEHEHPAADIDTIVVDPDDVVEAMRRNWRDQDEQRSHVLRVTPPLEGERKATPHVDEAHTRYPSDVTKPIHIGPTAFIVGHAAGSRHPDWERHFSFPNRHEEKTLFLDENDARKEEGDSRRLTEEEEEQWDEWWNTVVEMWEDRVRHALDKTEEITLTSQNPEVESTTVAVELKD